MTGVAYHEYEKVYYKLNGHDIYLKGYVYCNYTRYGSSLTLDRVTFLFGVNCDGTDTTSYVMTDSNSSIKGVEKVMSVSVHTTTGDKTYYAKFSATVIFTYNENNGNVEGSGMMTATIDDK